MLEPLDIRIRELPESHFLAREREVFDEVAEKWGSILEVDVPSVEVEAIGENVKHIVIQIDSQLLDGVGVALAEAGPTRVREDSLIPALGIIRVDRSDLEALGYNALRALITHEMAHVLGFGSLWSHKGLISEVEGRPVYRAETFAAAEYTVLSGGGTMKPIPIEENGGEGTAKLHWSETKFETELMTGFIDSAVAPLSQMTLNSFIDLGYQINSQFVADDFALPGTNFHLHGAIEIGGLERVRSGIRCSHSPEIKLIETNS